MRKIILSITAAMAILSPFKHSSAQTSGYHVQKTFHIASSGGWDYIAVNPVNDNLFVSHATQVNILNKNTGDSVGVISNTQGIHGIAFAPEFKKGFTSNGKMNTVTVFDINTNTVEAEVKTGDNPDAIMYDPFTKKVFVCNGHSSDVTVIDPATNQVTQTVALGGKPETAVSDENGKIYINIEDKNEVVVLDTKNYKVAQHWKTGKGDEPAGLAIDIKTKRLFIGCGNKLLVIMDATNGKIVKELPIGDGCDGVGFDNASKLIFSSCGEGTLSIVKEKSAKDFEVVENLPTKKGARTLAVDEKTHMVYLPTADFDPAPAEGVKPKRRSTLPGTFQVLVVGK